MKKQTIFILAAAVLLVGVQLAAAETITCWFPSDWKDKRLQAEQITEVLAKQTGLKISPRIANNYPEILTAFSTEAEGLVYVGSFVQAIINARQLGTPLAQAVNGKEFYSGVLVYPRGEDPQTILTKFPDQIAYTKGASSGESSAKAATGGKAAIAVASHVAAASAVRVGRAKAAFVKNWWWADNRQEFPMLEVYEVPGISEQKNPDNVLTASKAVAADTAARITAAALSAKDVFKAQKMSAFNRDSLSFSLSLMEKGGIDPETYNWQE